MKIWFEYFLYIFLIFSRLNENEIPLLGFLPCRVMFFILFLHIILIKITAKKYHKFWIINDKEWSAFSIQNGINFIIYFYLLFAQIKTIMENRVKRKEHLGLVFHFPLFLTVFYATWKAVFLYHSKRSIPRVRN